MNLNLIGSSGPNSPRYLQVGESQFKGNQTTANFDNVTSRLEFDADLKLT
jgi:hypothetical protein